MRIFFLLIIYHFLTTQDSRNACFLMRACVLVSVLPSHQQLKDQDAQGPKVNCKVMSLVLDDLWGHVLRSAHE